MTNPKNKDRKRLNHRNSPEQQKKSSVSSKKKNQPLDEPVDIRLNRYIAMAGICSRREADELIAIGAIKVNGKLITEMGYKVKLTDKVQVNDETIGHEKPVYIILNKPKGYVTTAKDEYAKDTVYDLIRGCKERVFSVGRLDKNTTGVLIFTNDGDMAQKLTHPKYKKSKIYHVTLHKNFSREHFDQLVEGIKLEDGFITPDALSYVGTGKNEIGIEVHSGKNRIVRRIFEHFGYKVKKLDRVYFAGLTKKRLSRGQWRYLEPAEINMLKIGNYK